LRWVVSIAAAITALDQLTKLLVVRYLGETEARIVIPGFFNLVHWRNTGAAWGMFQGWNWVLAGVSIITVLAIWFFRHTLQLDRPVARVALGLITGGIIGNFIDRVRVGSVIDFLDFYWQDWRWPAFNVADSAICIGVGLYIIATWRSESKANS
jgi:signal peptidase II